MLTHATLTYMTMCSSFSSRTKIIIFFFFANLLSNQNRHISEHVCKGTVILEFLCMIIWSLGIANYW